MQYLIPVPAQWHKAITQVWGERPDVYPSTNGHNGTDWGIPESTPILAAAPGQVLYADLDVNTARSSGSGYGYYVKLQHADGSISIYGHMQDGGILVKTGQWVQMGEIIGRSGNTGFSTGPHLHFETRHGLELCTCFDHAQWLVGEIPAEGGLMQAELLAEGDLLILRGRPVKGESPIGSLRTGDKMRVLGLAGADAWLQVDVFTGELSGKSGYVKYEAEWVRLE